MSDGNKRISDAENIIQNKSKISECLNEIIHAVCGMEEDVCCYCKDDLNKHLSTIRNAIYKAKKILWRKENE